MCFLAAAAIAQVLWVCPFSDLHRVVVILWESNAILLTIKDVLLEPTDLASYILVDIVEYSGW